MPWALIQVSVWPTWGCSSVVKYLHIDYFGEPGTLTIALSDKDYLWNFGRQYKGNKASDLRMVLYLTVIVLRSVILWSCVFVGSQGSFLYIVSLGIFLSYSKKFIIIVTLYLHVDRVITLGSALKVLWVS